MRVREAPPDKTHPDQFLPHLQRATWEENLLHPQTRDGQKSLQTYSLVISAVSNANLVYEKNNLFLIDKMTVFWGIITLFIYDKVYAIAKADKSTAFFPSKRHVSV
jgi:hypothetical protein